MMESSTSSFAEIDCNTSFSSVGIGKMFIWCTLGSYKNPRAFLFDSCFLFELKPYEILFEYPYSESAFSLSARLMRRQPFSIVDEEPRIASLPKAVETEVQFDAIESLEYSSSPLCFFRLELLL